MATQTTITFSLPTTNNDGSPITEALSANVLIDTVNPPVKSFPVPAAQIAAAVAGVVTVTFAELGFVGVPGTAYFADVDVSDADGTSPLSNQATFIFGKAPNAPTGFKVS